MSSAHIYIHIYIEYVSRMELLGNRIYVCSAIIDIGNQPSRVVILTYTLTSNA